MSPCTAYECRPSSTMLGGREQWTLSTCAQSPDNGAHHPVLPRFVLGTEPSYHPSTSPMAPLLCNPHFSPS